MNETIVFWLTVAGVAFVLITGMLALVAKFYRKVEQGRALIVNKLGKEPIVTFTGTLVIPIIHKAEVMDISLKTIEIDRHGKEGLICHDNIRADIKVAFFVRVNKTREDVLKVAQAVGCERASHQRTVEELFAPKFSEALKTVGKRLAFESLYKERESFKDQIIEVIGKDLNGYVLEDAAIDFLEQTPLASMDASNTLDSVGIKKITEITTQQNVLTNQLKQTERKAITKQNVEADEAVLELERQRADAEAKQKREVATMVAREEAETSRVQAEERARAEQARIKSEEAIAIESENKQRQVEVAQKNRERVVAVENERVEKDRALEAISREREVELQRIEKEKALEIERKAIADVVRQRVAVEKTVAEEEERIKDVKAVAEATRQKDVVRITAEGKAEELVVKEVKAAQAKEEVAKSKAREQLTIANADLEVSDKQAQAKIRLAEGTQAEEAAQGLAQAKVKEADATATEKQGLANVRVKEADAVAIEKQGMARVKVSEAEADVIEKQGLAHAQVEREKMLALAAGEQERGLAEVRVKQAQAKAVEELGTAEAAAIREKMGAEAAGLAQKAEAMRALDGTGREHEEFRLQLEKAKEVELAGIDMRKEVAQVQASVMSEAMGNAKINIVGGDGQFFERFVRAVTLGHSIDGTVNGSETLKTLFGDYLNGQQSLPEDLKSVLGSESMSADNLQKLSVSALLGRMLMGADGPDKGKLQQLLAAAKELGVDGYRQSSGKENHS